LHFISDWFEDGGAEKRKDALKKKKKKKNARALFLSVVCLWARGQSKLLWTSATNKSLALKRAKSSSSARREVVGGKMERDKRRTNKEQLCRLAQITQWHDSQWTELNGPQGGT